MLAASVERTTAWAQMVDEVFIVVDPPPTANVDMALAVADATPFDDVDTVVIARDDGYADALASGVLQDGAPLLPVPSDGPLPMWVRARVSGFRASRPIVLGGDSAVAPSIVDPLADEAMAARTG